MLLGLLTIYIIAYLKHLDLIAPGGLRKKGLVVFVSGIVLQELLLFAQGMMAVSYSIIPFINEALFLSAVVMLCGIAMLNTGMARPTALVAETAREAA